MGVEAPRFIDLLIAASPMERRKHTIIGQEVYFRPLTRKQIADAMPKDSMKRDPDYDVLFMLVASAEFEDGSKVFRMEDIEKLRAAIPAARLQELTTPMLSVQYPTDKEAEQELTENPPSITA